MKTIEEMLIELPHLDSHKRRINIGGYVPTLYHADNLWYCNFTHLYDGNDILIVFYGETPYEAVLEAYNHCKQLNLLKSYENY